VLSKMADDSEMLSFITFVEETLTSQFGISIFGRSTLYIAYFEGQLPGVLKRGRPPRQEKLEKPSPAKGKVQPSPVKMGVKPKRLRYNLNQIQRR
jgi:hypothetical protein